MHMPVAFLGIPGGYEIVVVGLIASAAVAAWVVTWMIIVHRPPGP